MNGKSVRANRAGETRAAAGRAGVPRRGVALMLAMVALGTASILTTAYVISRSNSSGMALNAMDMSQASWSAEAGAELALAALETDTEWESDADPARLINALAFGRGDITVLVTDVNGDEPSADTRDLVMTIIAESGGVRSVKQRMIHRRPDVPVQEAADGWLKEFAIFGENALLVQDGATVAPWKLGPGALSGGRAKIGAGFNSSSSFYIGAGTLVNVGLYTDSSASVALKGALTDPRMSESFAMPLDTPATPARLPTTLRTLVNSVLGLLIPPSDVKAGSAQTKTITPGVYADIETSGTGSVVVMNAGAGGEFYIDELRISGGALRIKGDARICVNDDIRIENGGTIEFYDDDSKVIFYTRDDIRIEDAAVGVPESVARISNRDAQDVAAYTPPSRLRIAPLGAVDGGKASPYIMIDDHSLVVANIHAPTGTVSLMNGSTLIGRVTGLNVGLLSGTKLLYDCELDNRCGFSERHGPLYKNDCTPIDGLLDALTSFNSSSGPDALVSHLLGSLSVTLDLGDSEIPIIGGGPVITPRAVGRVESEVWPSIVRGMEQTGGTASVGGAPPPGLIVVWTDPDLYRFEEPVGADSEGGDGDSAPVGGGHQLWTDGEGGGSKTGLEIMESPL